MKHCWHDNKRYGHEGKQCCQCGMRWWEGMTVPLLGHGPFAPKSSPLPLPNKPCDGNPLSKGKGGRAANINDVDQEAYNDQ
jgi:hypothetical protein